MINFINRPLSKLITLFSLVFGRLFHLFTHLLENLIAQEGIFSFLFTASIVVFAESFCIMKENNLQSITKIEVNKLIIIKLKTKTKQTETSEISKRMRKTINENNDEQGYTKNKLKGQNKKINLLIIIMKNSVFNYNFALGKPQSFFSSLICLLVSQQSFYFLNFSLTSSIFSPVRLLSS